MSLDVYLTRPRAEPTEAARVVALLLEHGFDDYVHHIECHYDTRDVDRLYDGNIMGTTIPFAELAGIYGVLWEPEESGIAKAAQLIEPLEKGLQVLWASRKRYNRRYSAAAQLERDRLEGLISFVEQYAAACREHPDADVRASR